MRFVVDPISVQRMMADLALFDRKVRVRIEKAALTNWARWAAPKVASAVPNGNESLAKSIDFKVGRTKPKRALVSPGKFRTIKPSAAYAAVGVRSGVNVVSATHGKKASGYQFPRSSRTGAWPLREAHMANFYQKGFRVWRKGMKPNRKGKGWRRGLYGQSLSAPRWQLNWFPDLTQEAVGYLQQELQSAIADSSKYTPKPRAPRVRRRN